MQISEASQWPALLRALAQKHLRHRDFQSMVNMAPSVRDRCVALARCGLQFNVGEELLGFLHDQPMGQTGNALMVTTHGLIGKSERLLISCAYADITGAYMLGWPESYVRIKTLDGMIPYPKSAAAQESLMPFLQAVSEVPAELRRGERRVPVMSADDPTGAMSASHMLSAPNPSIAQSLRFVHESAARGHLSVDTAHDAVLRLFILDRTLTMGRGMAHERWLSPLSAPDLSQALARTLGRVVAVYPQGDGGALDIEVHDKFQQIGIEPRSDLEGVFMQTVMKLRVVFEPMTGCTGFRLLRIDHDNVVPLDQRAPRFLQLVHPLLTPLEAQLTACRAVLGWQPTYDELLHQGGTLAPQRLHEMLGAT